MVRLAVAPRTEGLQDDISKNLESEVRQADKELAQLHDADQRFIRFSITEARQLLDASDMGEDIRAEPMGEVQLLEGAAALEEDPEIIQMAHESIEQGWEESG